MKKILFLSGFACLVLLFGCGGGNRREPAEHDHATHGGVPAAESEDHDHGAATEHDHGGETGREAAGEHADHDHAAAHDHHHIKIPPEKQKAWGIETGLAAEMELHREIRLPGIISLNENRTAHVSSFTSGKAVSVRADLGRDVDRGEILAVINSPEFAEAQGAFLQAHTRANLLRREYERAKALLEQNAIEKKEYLRREAEYEAAAMEYGVRESNLRSYGMTHEQIEGMLKTGAGQGDGRQAGFPDPSLSVRSPLRGRVIFRDIILGENVEADKTLYTVSDLSDLWALVDAYEKDLPDIGEKSRVKILSPLYPDTVFPGKIDNIGSTVDPKLRTVKIRAVIDNGQRLLKPNMFIQAVIESSAGIGKILAVPEEAVQVLNGEKIVFLLEGEDVFAVEHVQIGDKFGDMRAITGGIHAGQKIVLKGAFNLKAELNKGAGGHGHVH